MRNRFKSCRVFVDDTNIVPALLIIEELASRVTNPLFISKDKFVVILVKDFRKLKISPDLIIRIPDKGIVCFLKGPLKGYGAIKGEILPRGLIKLTWNSLFCKIVLNEFLGSIG